VRDAVVDSEAQRLVDALVMAPTTLSVTVDSCPLHIGRLRRGRETRLRTVCRASDVLCGCNIPKVLADDDGVSQGLWRGARAESHVRRLRDSKHALQGRPRRTLSVQTRAWGGASGHLHGVHAQVRVGAGVGC
jgi:hypothetical protein